jgi:toxin-antitoxin system PIN domain toxin
MNTCVVDANAWLALLFRRHEHSDSTRRWFDRLGTGEAGVCRITQLTVVRLLGNRTIMGEDALSATEAWSKIVSLLEDERVAFLVEPPGLDSLMPDLLRYLAPTPNLAADAYLAAFAIGANLALVTRDRGFQQFRGLRVRFLEP